MKRVAVDRIEGDKVVLENEEGKTAVVDAFLLPTVSEGDILEITVNYDETKTRREAVHERVNRLWKD